MNLIVSPFDYPGHVPRFYVITNQEVALICYLSIATNKWLENMWQWHKPVRNQGNIGYLFYGEYH
jgi:hypothetical protein